MTELLDVFEVRGYTWHFANNEHINPMYYRYLTTSEVNDLCGTDLAVPDDEHLGKDELGFFVWDERFHRPVVIIELELATESEYAVQVSRTNGSGPRPGAAGPLSSEEYRESVDSIDEANEVIRDYADEFTPNP